VKSPSGKAAASSAAVLESPGPIVLPALLLCDFGHLAHEVERLEDAGARALHLDVMDGRFVPQLTYGPVVVEAVQRTARVPIEVHLMIEEPERSIAEYARLGADVLTVHVESTADPRSLLRAIADLGPRAHVAISPGTPVEHVEPLLDVCDGVLVMSVEPGYGGQQFDPRAVDKIARLADLRRRSGGRYRIGVDGGIAADTVAGVAAAGAEWIVAGSAVIRSANYARAIADLEGIARSAA